MLEKPKYKQYDISWCDLCDRFIISCNYCNGASCNGSSCDKCHDDFTEFNLGNVSVLDYLTEQEIRVYDKIRSIKRLMLHEMNNGIYNLDFEKLHREGSLCKNDLDYFGLEKYKDEY